MIKRYSVIDILSFDGVLYNTNNHFEIQPSDYSEKINLGNTGRWIDKFHDTYEIITLDSHDLKWMKNAFDLCSQTRRFSCIYNDELEETVKKYDFPKGNWFVRTERVSLKGGCYGCGPYTSLEMVIKSMVTCRRGHQPFNSTDEMCKIHLMRWVDIDPEKEFRIFVYNNNITAFSTQNIYSVNEWLNGLSDEEILSILSRIKEYFNKEIKYKMEYMGNYTMDLAILPLTDEVYFIEPNSFGKEYSAGSALYHWINDEEILYSLNPSIQLRYTSE